MQMYEIIETAIILIHLFFQGVEKGCTENKWVKLSLGCHDCKTNERVNFLPSIYKIVFILDIKHLFTFGESNLY